MSTTLNPGDFLDEAIRSGRNLAEATNEVTAYIQSTGGHLNGVFETLLNLAGHMQAAGIPAPAALSELLALGPLGRHVRIVNMLAEGDSTRLSELLAVLVVHFEQNRARVALAQKVHEVPPPLQVQIVGLPTRDLVQTVLRDDRDEIIRTVTREADATA